MAYGVRYKFTRAYDFWCTENLLNFRFSTLEGTKMKTIEYFDLNLFLAFQKYDRLLYFKLIKFRH